MTWDDPTGLIYTGPMIDGIAGPSAIAASAVRQTALRVKEIAQKAARIVQRLTQSLPWVPAKEKSYGDKVAERWNESWGGFGQRWEEAWAGVPQRWEQAWAGVPNRWDRSMSGIPDRVHTSVAGVPGRVRDSWYAFTDYENGMWLREVGDHVSGGVTVSACAYVCIQGGISNDGWSAGVGAGPSLGVEAGLGAGAPQSTGWSVRGQATFAVGGIGMYGEMGVGEGPNPVVGGGLSTGLKAGVSGWIIYEGAW